MHIVKLTHHAGHPIFINLTYVTEMRSVDRDTGRFTQILTTQTDPEGQPVVYLVKEDPEAILRNARR
jgi:hypothetical protein